MTRQSCAMVLFRVCFGFVLDLFWICFRFVLRCFVSVVRAALVPKLVAMAMSLRCKVSAISAFSRPTTYTLSITSCLVTVVHTKPVITILVSKLVAMATSLSIWGLPSNIWFLGPIRAHNPNGILIGSAVFAEMTAECPYTLEWDAPFPDQNCLFPRVI